MRNVNEDFSFDLFLSHSSKDKAVGRPLAERLRADGLEHWRVLGCAAVASGRRRMVCMSTEAFGSVWVPLARPAVSTNSIAPGS
jgi:hypothetical protein